MLNFLDSHQNLIWTNQKKQISELVTSHKYANYNNGFIASLGINHDGREKIAEVIERGCNFIIAEDPLEKRRILYENKYHGVTFLWVTDLQSRVAEFIADFYGNYKDGRNLHSSKIIAVTGTNGKTSISCYINSVINKLLAQETGLIGTLGYGVSSRLKKSLNTTPGAEIIQQQIHHFVNQLYLGYVIIEASSHGIEQDRLKAIEFEQAIFTNLTHEHLDYHHNLENYYQAKKKLFTNHEVTKAIINIDDEYGKRLFKELRSIYQKQNLYAVSKNIDNLNELGCEFYTLVEDTKFSEKGISGTIKFVRGNHQKTAPLKTSLLGIFNLDNIACAITSLALLDINPVLATLLMSEIKAPLGRMQLVNQDHPEYYDKPKVIIDFAHTPDALNLSLESLKIHGFRKIITVFGCGGNRDKEKRPKMGKIAYSNSYRVIITSDNPRDENPRDIAQDIIAGISNPNPEVVQIITNREQAIQQAIKLADQNSLVFIAGKGHETEQIIGNNAYHFSDHETVKNYWRTFDKNK